MKYLVLMLLLTGCGNNTSTVYINDPLDEPIDGIIPEENNCECLDDALTKVGI